MLGEARASVQRFALAPPAGFSANLGAARCVILESNPRDLQLAVLSLVNEGVWIGLLVPPSTGLVSATADEISLRFEKIGEYPNGDRFLRSAPFAGDGRDANVEVTLQDRQGALGMRLALMTSSAFTARFGALKDEPAPTPYGKWRLP